MVFYPGGTREQFEAVVGEIGDAFNHATGRLYFATGPADDGWTILTVWESQEAFQAWVGEHVGPAHARAGDRGWQTIPRFTDFSPELIAV
jgi:heme-degrading monooxygenase HmoA